MEKILKCYLIPKKSYDTLSKGAIFFGQHCITGKAPKGQYKLKFASVQKNMQINVKSATKFPFNCLRAF